MYFEGSDVSALRVKLLDLASNKFPEVHESEQRRIEVEEAAASGI